MNRFGPGCSGSLTLFQQMFANVHRPPQQLASRLWLLSPVIAVAFVVADTQLYAQVPRASPAEVFVAIYIFGGLAYTMLFAPGADEDPAPTARGGPRPPRPSS